MQRRGPPALDGRGTGQQRLSGRDISRTYPHGVTERGDTSSESSPAAGCPTIAWLRPDQCDLVRQIAISAGLRIVAAGGPDPKEAGAVARVLEAQALTDLRGAMATTAAGLVLIADPGSFATGRPGTTTSTALVGAKNDARIDAEELDAARDRGVKVASLVPLPAGLATMAQVGAPMGGARPGTLGLWCELLPLARLAPRFCELVELVEHFGPVRSVSVAVSGDRVCGGLGPRLIDALDVCAVLLGEPESVFAAHASGAKVVGDRYVPTPVPESLAGLEGELALTMRYEEGRAASVLCSDQGGRFGLHVTAIGPRGRVTITDDALLWLDPQGRTADDPAHYESSPAPFAGITPEAFYVGLAGQQLKAYLAGGVGGVGRLDYVKLLSCAQAALLSARTGQPQSPATMTRLAGV